MKYKIIIVPGFFAFYLECLQIEPFCMPSVKIKRFIILYSLLLNAYLGTAQQNMIRNPDFEEYFDCDFDLLSDPLETVIHHWAALRATPRYFNRHCLNLSYSPFNGDGYMTINSMSRTITDSSGIDRRDYAQTMFTRRMIPDKPYYLEYYIRTRPLDGTRTISHHGVLFMDSLRNDLTRFPPWYPYITSPHIWADTLVSTTYEWTRLHYCFTPDSAYGALSVGVFHLAEEVTIGPGGNFGVGFHDYDAFYLIEVEDTLRMLIEDNRDTICAGDCINISTNHSRIVGDFIWNLPGSDIGSSTDSAVLVCYPEPGVYDIGIEVTHCHGQYDSLFRRAVVVLERPESTGGDTLRLTLAEGDTISLNSCIPGTEWNISWVGSNDMSCLDCHDPFVYAEISDTLLAIIGADLPCPDTCVYILDVKPLPVAVFSLSAQEVCEGECIQLFNESLHHDLAWRYSLNNNSPVSVQENNPVHLCLAPGTYNIQIFVQNDVGRDSLISDPIRIIPAPKLLAVNTYIKISTDQEIKLDPAFLADSYLWQASSGIFLDCNQCPQPAMTATEFGQILLIAANEICSDSILYNVDIIPKEPQIFIPDAFSPNKDGINELFKPLGLFFELLEIQIYDRYGGLLFHEMGVQSAWNGISRGKAVEQGVYVYLIKIRDEGGNVRVYSGDVLVIY